MSTPSPIDTSCENLTLLVNQVMPVLEKFDFIPEHMNLVHVGDTIIYRDTIKIVSATAGEQGSGGRPSIDVFAFQDDPHALILSNSFNVPVIILRPKKCSAPAP